MTRPGTGLATIQPRAGAFLCHNKVTVIYFPGRPPPDAGNLLTRNGAKAPETGKGKRFLKMRLARRIAALGAVAIAIWGLTLGSGASALAVTHPTPHVTTHAAAKTPPVAPVLIQYTAKSTTSAVAGYFASAFGVYFTHITNKIGGNANSLDRLDAGATNGVGDGLCDAATGAGAQIGFIYDGAGKADVVFATGNFGLAVQNNNPCENGAVNPGKLGNVGLPPYAPGASDPSPSFGTLLAGIPVTHTIEVDALFDQKHAHNGCAAGQVVFDAEDLSQGNGVTEESPCITMPAGTVFNEADAGAIANDTTVSQLPGSIPEPDGGSNILVRFAHVNLDGNGPNGEVKGTIQNNPAWNVFAVGSTNNGATPPGGTLLIGDSRFASDHFTVDEGPAVG